LALSLLSKDIDVLDIYKGLHEAVGDTTQSNMLSGVSKLLLLLSIIPSFCWSVYNIDTHVQYLMSQAT
jgi:hypothetical protein